MAERTGDVLFDKGSSRYYVQIFYRWPRAKRRKRHRIYAASEGEAKKILRRIRAEIAHGAQLHSVLQQYVGDRSKNAFINRWRALCDEKDQDVRAGVLDPRRVHELRRYEDRGYLAFFRSVPLHSIDRKKLVA
jgi:hypothetical protein